MYMQEAKKGGGEKDRNCFPKHLNYDTKENTNTKSSHSFELVNIRGDCYTWGLKKEQMGSCWVKEIPLLISSFYYFEVEV